MNIITDTTRPRGICGIVAAVEGFGKTTLAARLPQPLFIDTDRGTDGIPVAKIEFGGTLAEMKAVTAELRKTGHGEYRTLVIDTADALEQALAADFCRQKGWKSMEELDYGKCWNMFKPEWAAILDGLKDLAKRDGWNVFFCAHVAVKEFADPLKADRYNRIALKLAPSTAAMLKEWADIYMTGLFKTDVETDDTGMKKIRHAVKGARMCYLEHNEKYDAKCRACMRLADGSPFPASMTLDRFAEVIGPALTASTAQDTPPAKKEAKAGDVPKPQPKPQPKALPKPQPQPEEEQNEEAVPELRPDLARLADMMKTYGLTEDELYAYLRTKNSFPKELWPFGEIPPRVCSWITDGIAIIAPKAKALAR